MFKIVLMIGVAAAAAASSTGAADPGDATGAATGNAPVGGNCASMVSCTTCQADTACGWYAPKIDATNAKCGPAELGTFDDTKYTIKETCEACDFSGCEECYSESTCTFYTSLAGLEKCATEVPTGGDTVWSVDSLDTCKAETANNAKIAACDAKKSCSGCQEDVICGWWVEKVTGVQDCSLKDGSALTTGSAGNDLSETCLACSSSACAECQDEDGCSWSALKVFDTLGKCTTNADVPSTHDEVDAGECPSSSASGLQASAVAVAVAMSALILA